MKYLFLAALLSAFAFPFKSSAQAHISPADSIPLNQAAPDFSLRDIHGKTVSLSAFRGKVVVLDFWATWCVPCHENFPAVQKAVNHFKSDKDVVFLFIDTRERSNDYVELARDDMQKNHYDFRVLFDEKSADGQQNKYYKIFGMAGIPTHFIIDTNGVIRYKFVGYDGRLTEEQRAEELIRQVKLVKASS